MNWKDVPHLFANGRFGAKYLHHKELDIHGFRITPKGSLFLEFDDIGSFCGKVADCTLIARRVEDMTDEEKEIHNSLRLTNVDVDPIYDLVGNFVCIDPVESPESFLYLLSIGVCPPPFWDETVIDIKTLEESK